ncbi:Hypothetical protein PBC10988_5370 [Planctomycetales bacterium 10988]|nr:Hypothetical protein PBC10988_5370 [Planctomycetales bacterium 10988]
MSKRSRNDQPEFGSDSFLDIVANIVGILIILVVVVGVRIGSSPQESDQVVELEQSEQTPEPSTQEATETEEPPVIADTPPLEIAPPVQVTEAEKPSEPEVVAEEPEPKLIKPAQNEPPKEPAKVEDPKVKNELQLATASMARLEVERVRLDQDLKKMQVRTAIRHAERSKIAFRVAYLQEQLNRKRQTLSQDKNVELELAREVQVLQKQLGEIDRALEVVSKTPSQVQKVDHHTTPLSRAVFEQEEHFQIRGGHIIYVPEEGLREMIKDDVKRQLWRLQNEDTLENTLGPLDGFHVKYFVARQRGPLPSGGYGYSARLLRWSITPIGIIGETTEEALAPNSQFRLKLQEFSPRRVTLLVWVYPDSFDDYRKIVEELHELGYTVAGHPQTEGESLNISTIGGIRATAQ